MTFWPRAEAAAARARQVDAGIFVICVTLLAFGYYYLERKLGLAPCALCMTQRLFFLLCGVFAGCSAMLGTLSRNAAVAFSALAMLASIAGAAMAGRQLWLQSLPPDLVPACGPGFEYLLENAPLAELMQAMLAGDSDCASVKWSLLGLSIPGWAAIGFGCLIGANAYAVALKFSGRTQAR